MASISISCLSRIQVVCRARTRNEPRRSPKSSSKQSNGKVKFRGNSLKAPPQPLAGGEATTYTRLPPKDDLSAVFAAEIKLDDCEVAKLNVKDETKLENEDYVSEEEEEEEEEEGLGGNLGLSYGQFEIFEGEEGEDEDKYSSENEDGGKIENFDKENGYYEGELEEDVKEKGVPAVMRCFDRAKIFVKAGTGGNGVVAFRREKYVPMGGPSGGDGGRGGNVYVEVDESMNSLLPFRNSVHFRAGRGSHGQGRMQSGAKGQDVVVKVAPGTVIREAGKSKVLLELLVPGQKALLLPGGRGGRGNASFKSGTNKVPRIAENGEEGPEMWLELELKLVADVGIVGAPNAGKSTLLSVISAAQPTIANYPFTTLLPNLGVVSFDYDSTMVVADLPGLLEGAHRGFGLGHEFLRHTERCSALVHLIDGLAEQPEFEFDAVRLELEMFSPEIAEKPYIVAFNKMDLPEAYEKWPSFKEKLQARGIEPFCMSAVEREGTHEVISAAYQLLQKNKEAEKDFECQTNQVNLNQVADLVNKQRSASINDFEIFHDSGSNTWNVVGAGLQRFVQMTNWRYLDSEKRFQHVLEACGVTKSLMKLGVKEGDTVIVGDMEMVWHDSANNPGPSKAKKGFEDSIKWPQWKTPGLVMRLREKVWKLIQDLSNGKTVNINKSACHPDYRFELHFRHQHVATEFKVLPKRYYMNSQPMYVKSGTGSKSRNLRNKPGPQVLCTLSNSRAVSNLKSINRPH